MCEGRARPRDLALTLRCPTQRGGAVPSLAGSAPDRGAAHEGLTGRPIANAAHVHPHTRHTRVISKALSSRNGSQRFICIFFLCLSQYIFPTGAKAKRTLHSLNPSAAGGPQRGPSRLLFIPGTCRRPCPLQPAPWTGAEPIIIDNPARHHQEGKSVETKRYECLSRPDRMAVACWPVGGISLGDRSPAIFPAGGAENCVYVARRVHCPAQLGGQVGPPGTKARWGWAL